MRCFQPEKTPPLVTLDYFREPDPYYFPGHLNGAGLESIINFVSTDEFKTPSPDIKIIPRLLKIPLVFNSKIGYFLESANIRYVRALGFSVRQTHRQRDIVFLQFLEKI